MEPSLVVFLHGVGSRGADLAPLGAAWGAGLPGATFAAPDAPAPADTGGTGRQWFSIRGVTEANRPGRVVAARGGFDDLVGGIVARAGFGDRLDRVALVGFSQGAIMALDALASGRWPVAAVVAFSGRLATPPPLAPSVVTRLLLVHGTADRMMPVAEAAGAEATLRAAGVAVTTRILSGEGHSITRAGADAALAFLQRAFGASAISGSEGRISDALSCRTERNPPLSHPDTPLGPLGKAWLWLLGLVLVAAGLFFLVGGARLVWLGGSWYFVLAGVAIVASGVLVILREPAGAQLFVLTFLATIPWALWEVGLAFWPLVSRLFAMGVGALVVLLTLPLLRRADGRAPRWTPTLASAAVFAVGIVATAVGAFFPKNVIAPTEVVAGPAPADSAAPAADWAAWGGNDQGTRFSGLGDITPENVGTLEVAWTARTGETPESTGSGAEDQNTPLQVGDTLYVCTAYGTVLALDVDTGAEKWRYVSGGTIPAWQRCRGVAYYDGTTAARVTPQPDGSTPDAGVSPRRIFVPTVDARLIGLDADTGKPAANFGTDGIVDLKVGMGEVKPGYYQQTSTPLVAANLVIVGGRVADNNETQEPPGVVRAFDAVTGQLVWAWDPGNPEVTREPLSPEGYTRGTPNVWSAMSYDPDLGLVYLPTGNATPDFWAGERTENDDKWSSSIVAVNVATGRPVWHFQTVHHDLWDFDVPAQPVLYDIPNPDGTTTPAVVTVSKTGMIYLLNRATGAPLADIVDKPVPQGNVPGERYAPTQPFSVGMPMIGNATLTEADMWGATPFDQLMCRISFKGMRVEGIFTPPGLDRALQMPGSLGGMNWGSVSIDPTTSLMYVNDMRLGLANYMIPRDQVQGGSGIEMGVVPQLGTPFGAMRERYLSPLGVPCQAPPYGTLSAIDLESHELVWQVPVGTVQDTGPLGIRMGLPIPIGMPTLGPSLATRSGLVFFAGTQDFYLRAFDSRTGAEVWKSRLPVGSQGGPMTYRSPTTGKQYVVITAGGARQSPERGDYVIAYALP